MWCNRYHDLLTNHFYASTRLVSRHEEKGSGKYSRKYDKFRTSYRRLLATLNPKVKRYKKPVEQRSVQYNIVAKRKRD